MKHYLFQDQEGREYTVQEFCDKDIWTFKVKTRGFALIGYANCLVNSKRELGLADFMIHSEVKPAAGSGLLSYFFPRPARSFQRLGIGSALMRHIQNTARIVGFQTIVGKITPGDLGKQPWLPEWYSNLGFIVTRGKTEIRVDYTC